MDNFLFALLQHAEQRPSEVAILDPDGPDCTPLNWRELVDRVCQTKRWLEKRAEHEGFSNLRGLPVGYVANNSVADLSLILACQMAGAIEVPLDVRAGETFHSECWSRFEGCWLGTERGEPEKESEEAGNLESLRVAASSVDRDATALVLFTSGTTREPKGVMLSQRNLLGNAVAKLIAVPQRQSDVRLTVLSYAHAYARTCDLGTWLLSGSVLVPGLGFRDWQRLAARARPTLINTAPSIAERIFTDGGSAVGRLRILGCGGAAMSESDFSGWQQRGVTVIQGYGLTEAAPVICSATPDDARAGWVGRLVAGWESKIVDSVLHVRGSHSMLGYWKDREGTAERIDPRGWLNTGDVVRQDPSTGMFMILGRTDDVIVLANGHKVHPATLERLVASDPLIKHAFICPIGSRLGLWVETESEVSPAALNEAARTRLAGRPTWEIPSRIHLFPAPLAEQPELLTQKGTIRRAAALRWIATFERAIRDS